VPPPPSGGCGHWRRTDRCRCRHRRARFGDRFFAGQIDRVRLDIPHTGLGTPRLGAGPCMARVDGIMRPISWRPVLCRSPSRDQCPKRLVRFGHGCGGGGGGADGVAAWRSATVRSAAARCPSCTCDQGWLRPHRPDQAAKSSWSSLRISVLGPTEYGAGDWRDRADFGCFGFPGLIRSVDLRAIPLLDVLFRSYIERRGPPFSTTSLEVCV